MAIFHGPVRVPEGAAVGTATVSLDFDAWENRSVEGTTFEMDVVLPQGSAE